MALPRARPCVGSDDRDVHLADLGELLVGVAFLADHGALTAGARQEFEGDPALIVFERATVRVRGRWERRSRAASERSGLVTQLAVLFA
jgi:hypothetical protein